MSDLPRHPVHDKTGIDQFDVLIAGSGPIGATYARFLVDKGLNVVMVEIGDQDTRIPGAHKKNEIEYQKDIDRFVKVIQGALSTVSVPTSSTVLPTLDPAAWQASDPSQMIISNGRNPHQQEYNNLGAQAVTRGVGGMATHWTCATPEFLKGLERPKIFPDHGEQDDKEWDLLYRSARSLIGTSEHEFDESIRHNAVLRALQKGYPDRVVKALPLACHRLAKGSPYVQWHAPDNIFGDMFTDPNKKNSEGVQRGCFQLLTNTCCTRLIQEGYSNTNVDLKLAEVMDLLAARFAGTPDAPQTNFAINAKTFVVAAGAVATPQILAKSGFGGWRDAPADVLIPNLGKRITEQPMAFCQVLLRREIVEDIGMLDDKPQWWQDAVNAHRKANPKDPLPIPFQDGEPQVTIPATIERPWHTQIHRDAFSYGEAGPRVDSRVVVDLRFFGMQAGDSSNILLFEKDITDAYGMPQPTFEYLPTTHFASQATNMMNDMTNTANIIGGYLPGSEPQFMTPGLALHLGGTARLGQGSEIDESVANYNSQVWKFKNLYVGGNGVIPTPFGANPTLTSMALAIRAAKKLYTDVVNNSTTAPLPEDKLEPTPESWVDWLFNESDPNFPRHKSLRIPHRVVSA
ncbi:putative pyranose oxidase [Leucogyrophana mollusca]|uniref:Pyranose oxidase n=1 Tax=Leucogyrophana mollusca TaxID=85980 RepID=A0ACB8BF65_9AGAM|nr:putative pyranose oxidase [Leucogyrophana mollusca]